MASTLKQLRSAAGFRTAADFAQSIDMSEHTYARYESNPSKIPLEKAWMLADRFGCSIDAIVDREQIEVKDARGEVQRAYDALSDALKSSFDEYLEFLVAKNNNDRARAAAEERRGFEELARRYEVMFLDLLDKNFDPEELTFLGGPEQLRDEYRDFVQNRLMKRVEGKTGGYHLVVDKKLLAGIMAAYDRTHGIGKSDLDYTYSTSPDLGDRLFISFDSGNRAKKGGEA